MASLTIELVHINAIHLGVKRLDGFENLFLASAATLADSDIQMIRGKVG